jgi:hypothetical protein
VTRHLELGDFEGLLFIDPDPTLRQVEHLGFAHVDLQAMVEQFALDPLFVLVALRQVVGTAADQQGAAQRSAPEA